MVTKDRAQLILVGAIAIGLVLIAMTVVLNSAVFTENVASGSADEVSGDVQEFDRGAVRDVQSVALRVNHAKEYRTDGYPGESNLRADVRSNVSQYSDLVAESYADTGSVYVNVSPRGETMGTRIVQNADDDFQDGPGPDAGDPDWDVVTSPFQIGWFVMNVDVHNVSQTNSVDIELRDSAGELLTISLRQTSDEALDVRSDINGGSVSDVTCDPVNGRVLLDLADGTSYTGDCSFNSTEKLSQPYSGLEISGGANGEGKYDLVVNQTDPGSFTVPPCDETAEPCRSVAVWSIEFGTHYRTQSIGYARNHSVEVYGE